MEKQSLPVSLVGMVWYAPEHFTEVKAMMEDGHALPRTHADWERKAEKREQDLRAQGVRTVRAHLVPDAFREFCRANGLNLNTKARTQFANLVAIEEHRKGG